MKVAQVSSGLFSLILCLSLCQPALAPAPNWHDGLHLARFKPRSIDSKAIVGASTAQIVPHAVPERGLAAAASTPAPAEFVSAAATYFQVRGKQTFFAGTNIFYILLRQTANDPLGFTDDGVTAYLSAQASYGVNLIRFFGNINGVGKPAGYGYTDTTDKAILVSIDPATLLGTYDETNFQRFDLVLADASLAGTYSIVTLVNGAALGNTTHPAVAGGMQWYVDQVLGNGTYGSGGSYNLFYSNPTVITAYKNYINTVLTRINTVNGRTYSEDPTVFSWELANEPTSTADQTGQTVAVWAAAIAAYIRTLDTNHMISTGEVGYDVQPGQNSSQCGPCASPEPSTNDTLARLDVPNPFSAYHNFINSGDSGKGVSYSLNTAIPDISFGTLHVYPEALGVNFSSSGDTDNYTWVNDYFIQPRAAQTAKLAKPLMIEEFGLTPAYGQANNVSNARAVVFNSLIQAAIAGKAAAIMTWEVLPMIIDRMQEYDFAWSSDGGQVIQALTNYGTCLNNGTCTDFLAPALAAPPVKQGQYCDVGQTPQMGCGYCNLVYQYVGGPLTTCAANGAAGPNSTTCQNEFDVLTCAGSCACAPPPPPPAPPIAAAPGCGYNTSLFSQQSVPAIGCTCCDAGFDYQDSCATQLSYNTSTEFKCGEPYVKPYCMCTCGFCPAPKPPAAPPSTSTAKKLSVAIAVPIGVLLLSLGVCVGFYLYSHQAKKQRSPDSFFKNGPEHGRSDSVKAPLHDPKDSAMASPAASFSPATSPGSSPIKPPSATV